MALLCTGKEQLAPQAVCLRHTQRCSTRGFIDINCVDGGGPLGLFSAKGGTVSALGTVGPEVSVATTQLSATVT